MGEVGGARLTTSSGGTPAERRQEILETTLQAVKRCQVRYGGKQELATEGSDEVQGLLTRLELVLGHGMREPGAPSLGLAVMRNVKDLVSQKDFGPGDTGGIWRMARTILNKHEYQRYLLLSSLTTDKGRGRAWLRSVLNEQSLERHLQMLLGDEIRLKEFYETWGFMRDQERANMLPAMAAGLTSIRFALKVDNPALNEDLVNETLPSMASLSTFLPSSLTLKPSTTSSANQNQDPSIAEEASGEQPVSISTKPRLKKKQRKRAPAQIVNFPEASAEVEEAVDASEGGTPLGGESGSPTLPANSYSTPAEVQASLDALLGLRTESMPRPRLSSSPGDPFVFDYSSARLDRVKGESEGELTGGIYEGEKDEEQKKDKEVKGGTKKPSPVNADALTPVTNQSVGALFPVTLGHNASVSDDGTAEEEPPSPKPDYALAGNSGNQQPEQVSIGRASHFSSNSQASAASSSNGLNREDLKQALLSVMEKKDEVEVQLKGLRALLDQEQETSSTLREDLGEVKGRLRETTEKLEARNSILARENELLKHQLKKYVGAVQKLRDGPQAYETLAQLEGPKAEEGSNKYIDYHYEASEYEKKLIQVAEMHGELLEFNENLQRTVQMKEAALIRLREELVRVRGPLPEDGEDTASLSSQDNASLGARVLVNIWIPSVFITGTGASKHHVYQVYVRIRDTEWNVYRRYSQFYELHQSLRKKDPIVNSFDFPPKKTVGNMGERFVEDRRRALQSYLRCIVNYLVTTNVGLSTCPDKATLLTFLPFFADAPDQSTSNGQASGLSIFSRRRRSDNNQTSQPNLVL